MIVYTGAFDSLRQLQHFPCLPVILRRVLLDLVAGPVVHETDLPAPYLQNVSVLVKLHIFIHFFERAPQTLDAICELQLGLCDLLVCHVPFLFFNDK